MYIILFFISVLLTIPAYGKVENFRPYLISKNHPMKLALDSIFEKGRPTLNAKTFAQAGFEIIYLKKRSYICVARHTKLPGYLVKVYFDSENRLKLDYPGSYWLVERCKGARQIRHAIKKAKIKHFQVPRKWLYQIPRGDFPQNSIGLVRQPILLLVEDMDLVPHEENLQFWKEKITKKQLREFVRIITKAHGSSYRASNVWLSKNGKLSFIDTEYPDVLDSYNGIRPYLSEEKKLYWDKLVDYEFAKF